MPELTLACTCGAVWRGHINSNLDNSLKLVSLWEQDHSGPGHAPCDAKTAARNRRKNERKALEDV